MVPHPAGRRGRASLNTPGVVCTEEYGKHDTKFPDASALGMCKYSKNSTRNNSTNRAEFKSSTGFAEYSKINRASRRILNNLTILSYS